jgi:hypothetical protein
MLHRVRNTPRTRYRTATCPVAKMQRQALNCTFDQINRLHCTFTTPFHFRSGGSRLCNNRAKRQIDLKPPKTPLQRFQPFALPRHLKNFLCILPGFPPFFARSYFVHAFKRHGPCNARSARFLLSVANVIIARLRCILTLAIAFFFPHTMRTALLSQPAPSAYGGQQPASTSTIYPTSGGTVPPRF